MERPRDDAALQGLDRVRRLTQNPILQQRVGVVSIVLLPLELWTGVAETAIIFVVLSRTNEL